MLFIEHTYTVHSDGTLTIPSEALREMSLFPGNTLCVGYFSKDEASNSFQEFLISKDSLVKEDNKLLYPAIAIPNEMLDAANIQRHADVEIACIDGAIVIYANTGFNDNELALLLEKLGLTTNLLAQLATAPEENL